MAQGGIEDVKSGVGHAGSRHLRPVLPVLDTALFSTHVLYGNTGCFRCWCTALCRN